MKKVEQTGAAGRTAEDAAMCAFAAALRAAPQARTADGFTEGVLAAVRAEEARSSAFGARVFARFVAALPIAAALALLCAVGSVFLRPSPPVWTMARLVAHQRPDGTFSSSSAAPYVQAFAVTVLAREPSAAPQAFDSAVKALVREQRADGGWATPALSARNVAALGQAAAAGSSAAQGAYRRGMRYLRARGVAALSADDLAREAKAVAARLGPSADDGLAGCVALCAVR